MVSALLWGGAPFSSAPSSTLFAATTPEWNKGVGYLGTMLNPKGASIDAKNVAELLDFVVSANGTNAQLDPGRRDNATGAYFFFNVNAPLAKVIKYAYNPNIPSHLTLPTSVRLGGWRVNPGGPIDSLWERVGNVREPLVMRGEEYEEITPDLTTGGYYRYETNRLMVLLNHQGKDFFISVTDQQKPSSVGRKGAIIGPDTDWNYFYSGQRGLSKSGLGWASSYMYSAFSVVILFEPDTAKGQTRYVTFKWLRAGWGGINMVQRENILEGCQRFAQGFRTVMESPQLPEAQSLIDTYAKIKSMSDQELSARLQPVEKALMALCRTDAALKRRDFQDLIESGEYLTAMSREERESLLMSESFKLAIGKKSFLDRMP